MSGLSKLWRRKHNFHTAVIREMVAARSVPAVHQILLGLQGVCSPNASLNSTTTTKIWTVDPYRQSSFLDLLVKVEI
jgi:hypothetical protein